MAKDESDGEITNEELVLQLFSFSKIPLLYMTDHIQKDIELYRKTVKINDKVIAWDVFDVCDREKTVDALKQPDSFGFLNCRWRNDEGIANRAIRLYPENDFYPDYD